MLLSFLLNCSTAGYFSTGHYYVKNISEITKRININYMNRLNGMNVIEVLLSVRASDVIISQFWCHVLRHPLRRTLVRHRKVVRFLS